jgi:hypothetical protein
MKFCEAVVSCHVFTYVLCYIRHQIDHFHYLYNPHINTHKHKIYSL